MAKKITKAPPAPGKRKGPPKGSGGRPVEFIADADVVRQVESMAGLGLTLEQIALVLGVCEHTLFNHRKKSEVLNAAYKKGRAQGAMEVTKGLRAQILKGNMTAIIFYCKTQLGWREVDRHEITAADGAPLLPRVEHDFSGMSDAELEAIIARGTSGNK